MNFALKVLVIIVTCGLLQLVLPWWIIAIVPFIVELLWSSKRLYSFFSGFYGISLLWLIYALVIDIQTNAILSTKIAALFGLPEWPYLMALITALVGGVIGGLASLSGNFLRGALND